MNEAVAYRLFRDGGVPAPRTAYARVLVTVPGKFDRKYFGPYDLVEDVSPTFLKERFDTAKGALLKPVTPSLFSYLGDDWKTYNQTYDPKSEISTEDKQRVLPVHHRTFTLSKEPPAEPLERILNAAGGRAHDRVALRAIGEEVHIA